MTARASRSAEAFGQSAVNDGSYLVYYVLAVMLTFGFLLMCNDRLASQQRQYAETLRLSEERLLLGLIGSDLGLVDWVMLRGRL